MINVREFDTKFRSVTPNDVVHMCCSYFETTAGEVITKSRLAEKVKVRQIMQYCMWRYSPMTLVDIAAYFKFHGSIGNHATVIHSKNTVENLMDVDKKYRADVCNIERALGIDRRDYLNSRFFMNLKRGDTITLSHEHDEGISRTQWRHLKVERRDGILYAVGLIRKDDESSWELKESLIYQDKFNMCIGEYADKLFVDES